jgi:prophage regulatory protein
MRILRLPAVEAKTGLKHSSIYDGIKKGTFPPPVPLGPKAVGWVEPEVDDWILSRIAIRDSVAQQTDLKPPQKMTGRGKDCIEPVKMTIIDDSDRIEFREAQER